MGRIAGVSPDQTRVRLLDAAARVFELKGYEGATVAEIAREAGLTSGAIYAQGRAAGRRAAGAQRAGDRVGPAPWQHRRRARPPVRPAPAAGHPRAPGHRPAGRGPARRPPRPRAGAGPGRRERDMAALMAEGQQAGHLVGDMSPDAAARFALMLSLGSMLVRSLDMPMTEPAEWSTFIDRLVDGFTAS